MNENENLVPKRRFKEFTNTGTWEQRKLEQLAQFNPKSSLPDKFEYVDLESVVGTEMISHRTETKENAPSRAQRLAIQGDVFYQTVRPYQKNNYLFDLPHNNYVFSTGYAQLRPFGDSYFLLSRLQDDKFVFNVLERSTGTSYPAINSSDLAQIEVGVPLVVEEQIKIGDFFKNLDNTIALHQRKLDKTKSLKSAYLLEMFPADGERKPKRRFAGFTDDWEQSKLDEVVKSHNAGVYIAKEKYGAGTNVIGVGNIYGGDSVDGEIYRLGPVADEKYILDENDLIYGESSLVPEGIARTMYVTKNGAGTAFAWHTRRVKINTDICNAHVLTLELNYNKEIRNYLISVSTQTALTGITTDGYFNTVIYYPSLAEQDKISSFFTKLDNLINVHQRKLEKLQNIKKAYLNELFV